MQGKIEIALLGRLAVLLDGRRVEGELRGRQGKLAFAYLALHRDRFVPRAELESAIWPERAPSDPGASLSTLLSRLRRVLWPGAIEGRAELRLNPGDGAIDVEAARAALARAESLSADDPEGAARAADEVLSLLSTELMGGFDAPWLEDERRDLEDDRLRALELRASAALRLQEPAAAEAVARELIRSLPYRESGHAYLLQALRDQGNSAEALRAYEDLRTLLRDELGTAPSREIASLHAGLISGDAAEDPAAQRPPAQPRSRTREELPPALRAAGLAGPAFVGRERELAALHDLFAGRGDGPSRLTLIEGDPGIGKTRVCAQLAAAVAQEGAATLYGRSEEAALSQFQPFVEALGTWAGAAPAAEVRQIAAGLPEAAGLVPQVRRRLPHPPRASDAADRLVVFDEIAALFGRLSAIRPVLLILDDLHWADEPTLMLLKHLVRSPEPIDCLIVGTYRSTEFESPLTETVAELTREAPVGELALAGLDEAEVAQLIAAGVNGEASDELVSEVASRSEGNPFFVSELIAGLASRSSGRGGTIPVGRGAEAMLERRLRAFEGHELDLLSLAAVIGRDFTFELLQEASGGDAERLALLLDRAAAERVAHEVPGRHGRYSFDHALIRDHLYARVGGPRRAQLHLRVAEALESISQSNPEPYLEQLAHHFASAEGDGARERAIEWSELAGWRAQTLHAHEQAAEHFGRALELLGEDGAPGRRADLLIARGNCLVKSAQTEPGRTALLDAATVARSLADGERLAEAALSYGDSGGTWSMNTGEADTRLIELLDEALARLDGGGAGLRARVSARLATELHWSDRADRAEELSRDSVELARTTGDPDLIYRALIDRMMSRWEPELVEERVELTGESLEWARRSTDRSAEANAAMWRCLALGEDAGTEHGWALVDELATRPVEESRNAQLRWVHAQLLVNRAIAEGRLGDAGALIGRMLELAPGSSDDPARAAAYSGFLISRESEQLAGLVDLVTEQLEAAPGLPALRMVGALVLLSAGRRDEAAGHLEALGDGFEALKPDATWALGVSHAAEVITELGDRERAARLYEIAVARGADRLCVVGGGAGTLGSMSRYLGLLALTAGDPSAAIAHLERAIEVNDRKGGLLEAAHTRVDLALALTGRDGVPARAWDLLDGAAGLAAKREGLVRLESRTRSARAELGLAAA